MNRTRSRTLSLESLDHRRVLAGNVSVSVVNGDLIVQGDTSGNGILVTQVAQGSYRVSSSTSNPTRINNGTAAVVRSGVTDDVIIRLSGGNDRVDFGNGSAATSVPDDVVVDLGAGLDTLIATRIVADSVNIFLGAAAENERDVLAANNCVLFGGAIVNCGGGNDTITAANCRVGGEFFINLGAGDDRGTINSGNAGSIRMYAGTGSDQGTFKGNLRVTGNVLADGGEDASGDDIDTATIDENATYQVGGSTTFQNWENPP